MDFASRGTPLYMIRVALGRLLIEFQADLSELHAEGLVKAECDIVKNVLKKAIEVFEKSADTSTQIPTSVFSEVAKHFSKYAKIYEDWNGNEGNDPGKSAERKKQVDLLSDRRRNLFRKLSQRQAEAAANPQLDLFADSLWAPFKELGEFLPERFPRVRQAVQTIVF